MFRCVTNLRGAAVWFERRNQYRNCIHTLHEFSDAHFCYTGTKKLRKNHKDSYVDFGNQFSVDSKIDGYFGSDELIRDIVYPFEIGNIKNKEIMEVGSGSGRILKMLSRHHPRKIISVEPSKAIEKAKKNNEKTTCEIEFFNIKGEDIDFDNIVDYAFSIGVLHHSPNAKKIVRKIHRSLRKNGRAVFWLYGYEGNELYLFFFDNLRRITRLMPDMLLRAVSQFLNIFTTIYIFLCKFFDLPLKRYMIEVFIKFSWEKQVYVIFDQLNPSYSKYYTKKEVEDLVSQAGLEIENLHHRHGYSWTVIAVKR